MNRIADAINQKRINQFKAVDKIHYLIIVTQLYNTFTPLYNEIYIDVLPNIL